MAVGSNARAATATATTQGNNGRPTTAQGNNGRPATNNGSNHTNNNEQNGKCYQIHHWHMNTNHMDSRQCNRRRSERNQPEDGRSISPSAPPPPPPPNADQLSMRQLQLVNQTGVVGTTLSYRALGQQAAAAAAAAADSKEAAASNNSSCGSGSGRGGNYKKTADRILDLIQTEIDLQGKYIAELSRELGHHLEQRRMECQTNDDVLAELKEMRMELKANRQEMSQLRRDLSQFINLEKNKQT